MGNKQSNQITDLTKSINRLCDIIENKHEKQVHCDNRPDKIIQVQSISEDTIDQYVESLIKDNNIEGVPDFLERKIYKAVIKAILGSLSKTLETSNINLFGHNIKITIDP